MSARVSLWQLIGTVVGASALALAAAGCGSSDSSAAQGQGGAGGEVEGGAGAGAGGHAGDAGGDAAGGADAADDAASSDASDGDAGGDAAAGADSGDDALDPDAGGGGSDAADGDAPGDDAAGGFDAGTDDAAGGSDGGGDDAAGGSDAGGSDACVPSGAETCNGVDDDCNGTIDDVGFGDPHACGSCGTDCFDLVKNADPLTVTCVAGGATPGQPGQCTGQCAANWWDLDGHGCAYYCVKLASSDGTCNQYDDDCNGKIDDGVDLCTSLTDCGACGRACSAPHGQPACVHGGSLACDASNTACTVASCDCTGPGNCYWDVDGAAANGCEYACDPTHGGVEVCDGLDNDCNGQVDDAPSDTGAVCHAGALGECATAAHAGTSQCSGGTLVCVGPNVLWPGQAEELCNGKDDDCDGQIDDAPVDVGTACGDSCPAGQVAACVGACKAGTLSCVAGTRTCVGSTGPSAETCNGKDDDCNGTVDDVPGIGVACSGGGTLTQGTCTASWTCGGSPGPGPSGLTCAQAVGPAAETCNGKDDDCNGVVDDNVTGAGAACASACLGGLLANCVGQCKAGVAVCTAGAMTCTGSVGPSVEVCNGKDDDCDGAVDDAPTDAWVGQACCSTGNVADCQNTGSGTRCATGAYQCSSGGRICVGGAARSTEMCDGIDNDCNGVVDDVPGIGNACSGGGTNTQGECRAAYACTGAPGPGPYGLTCQQTVAPQPETCNGKDDNCDGLVDVNPVDVGAACATNCPGGVLAGCIGQCKAGTVACSAGTKVCIGSTGPSAETCDGLDNDCNGTIDDGFGYPNYNSDPKNCGGCGASCALANATSACHTDLTINGTGKGVCYVAQCNSGAASGFAYVATPGTCGGSSPPRDGPTGIGCNYACPVWPPVAESCNGKDDNCNGQVDELKSACAADGLVAPTGLCATQGVCQGQTIPVVCQGATGWKCNYAGVPNVELDANGNLLLVEKLCDAKDGNCNGTVDLDGFATLGQTCSPGVGACQTSGTIICKTATQSGCSVAANPAAATDELCDGKDNDCDGVIDERTPAAGTTCFNGGSHACKGWVDAAVAVPVAGGKTVWVYEYEASRPGATSTSPGASSLRACSVPGVLPWDVVTETQAAAACAAVNDGQGSPMRLCTAAEWQTACEGPSGVGSSKWSESVTPITYALQICNDANESVTPSVWATATSGAQAATTGKYCYTDWAAAGRLYDLSGNVGEWTSTTIVSGGATYYQLRGGSYYSPQGGTTCEFSFDIAQATFASYEVGFRCCADHAP